MTEHGWPTLSSMDFRVSESLGYVWGLRLLFRLVQRSSLKKVLDTSTWTLSLTLCMLLQVT